MAKGDPRTVVGAAVHARATTVTDNVRAVRNLFGRRYKEGSFEGRVTKVLSKKLGGRNYTWIEARWAVGRVRKTASLPLSQVKAGSCPLPGGQIPEREVEPDYPYDEAGSDDGSDQDEPNLAGNLPRGTLPPAPNSGQFDRTGNSMSSPARTAPNNPTQTASTKTANSHGLL